MPHQEQSHAATKEGGQGFERPHVTHWHGWRNYLPLEEPDEREPSQMADPRSRGETHILILFHDS